MNRLPKLVITDIDGVWTDGGMYYDQTGNEWKKFNTYDSAGVLFCHGLNIKVAIMTGENTKIVSRRAKKLNVDFLYQNVQDKYAVAEKLIKKLKFNWLQVAYIGDDIKDLRLLKKVGFSGAPKNAPGYIKKNVNVVTKLNGGEGAFREFIENMLSRYINLDDLINKLSLESQGDWKDISPHILTDQYKEVNLENLMNDGYLS